MDPTPFPSEWRRKPEVVSALLVPAGSAPRDALEKWLDGSGVQWQRVPLPLGMSYRVFNRFGGSVLARPNEILVCSAGHFQVIDVPSFLNDYEPNEFSGPTGDHRAKPNHP